MLEPIVGPNRVVARVSVDLNFTKKHIQEEIFDPEGTIRSQETQENISSSQGGPGNNGAVAGVDSNIEEPQNGNGNNNSQSSNESTKTLTNYEISKKIIEEQDNNYSRIKKISAAVTFDSTILEDSENKEEFLASVESIVEETIGYEQKRGDKISVKSFKFVGLKALGNAAGQRVDENGNIIQEQSADTITMIKTLLKEFSEYIQYIIAAILLFIFYRKFIVNHEVVVLGDGTAKKKDQDGNDIDLVGDMLHGYEDEFNAQSAKGRLKAKIKSQIMNNLTGLDEEGAAKYEILIEELDKEINTNPSDMAKMIELLLSEGNSKFTS